MTNKNIIIVLYPLKLRKFDLDRYEIKYLKKKFNIELHEFNGILYPKFISSFRKNIATDKRIFSFNSIEKWQNHIFKIKNKILKNSKKIFVINFLGHDSYNETRIFLFLKKVGIKRIDLLNVGLPKYRYEKVVISNYFHVIFKIGQLIFRTKSAFGTTVILIKRYILNNLIGRFLNIKPEFLLIAGNKYYMNEQNKNIKCIKGNSWDYSRYVRHSGSANFKREKNYAVFLANPGPKNPYADSFLYDAKIILTTKNWYLSLDRFFLKLENLFGIKVIIASHPKSKNEKKLNYLGSRRAYSNKTIDLVKNSKFVITSSSTSISYALLYKKPIYFIYSNELKKNPSLMKTIFFLSKLLGTNSFNIDDFFNKDLILSSKKINKKKYIYFIKNYLTSRQDKKANFQIIQELIESRR